jgi:hypothetical protein
MINDKLLQIKNILLSDTINPLSVNTSNDIIEEKTAYHGSPHDFNKFSLEYINTGEGNQAYGWGLYFAESKNVADNYKSKLSNSEIMIDNNKYINYYDNEWKDSQGNVITYKNNLIIHIILKFISLTGDIEKAINHINGLYQYSLTQNLILDHEKKWAKGYKEALKILKQGRVKSLNSGKIYEVDIPEFDNLLDWDKILKEQPNIVKKAILKISKKYNIELISNNPNRFIINNVVYIKNDDWVNTNTKKFVDGPLNSSLERLRETDGSVEKAINIVNNLIKEYKSGKFNINMERELKLLFGPDYKIDYNDQKDDNEIQESIKFQEEVLKILEIYKKNIPLYNTIDDLNITDMEGMDFYIKLKNKVSSAKETSLILNKYGIPGLQYFDGESRNIQYGTHNYVIWNDELINIIKKS